MKLDTNCEPFWLEILPERKVWDGKEIKVVAAQRTQFRRIEPGMILIARNEASAAVAKAKLQNGGPAAEALANEAFNLSMAQQGIVAWTEVGDMGESPAEPTPENIAAYMKSWPVFNAVEVKYILPALRGLDEKNASAPSRNGTTGARTRAKASAGTAHKRAKRVHTS
jgi:hypothetical protein